jgi:MYXO-CTERM domain-containing protein
LSEFAWPADGCGQPCATEPLMISELLSLGADVFERSVPDAERHPKPPELTKDEEKAFKESIKDLKPKEKKEREKTFKAERITVAERKALVARHKYVVSRLHYRYDAKNLPSDPQLGTAAAAAGGTAMPKGKDGEASTEIKTGDQNKLQIRYNNFHPWVPVINCQSPERYKWGKAGRDVHVLRKTWIADDLTRKSHTQIKPAVVVKTPIPDLGLGVAPAPVSSAGVGGSGSSAADAAAKDKGCGCRAAGAGPSGSGSALALLLAAGLGLRRRRR